MNDKPQVDLDPLPEVISPFLQLGQQGLLPALQATQKHYGWLPAEVLAAIANALHVPLADVNGVVEFYSLLSNHKIGKKVLRVCTDPACAMRGADEIYFQLQSTFGQLSGSESDENSATIFQSTCLGLCDHAPAILSDTGVISNKNIQNGMAPEITLEPRVFGTYRRLTKNCGKGKTTSLDDYGEYSALKHAKTLLPISVIEEIKFAGLVGRGGAAFPTGIKWEGAYRASGKEKFVVCNADESEPGTFKDRVLLGDDPHLIIEGMCIAGYSINATHGYIFLRGEYPYLLPGIEKALSESRNAGYLNEKFDIEVRLGAGAYICGEETALFESIEGKRGFPRVKPPFPTTNGLFDAPTIINNVETLANVPFIIGRGSSEYRQLGTEKSPGSKLFCLSGDINQPGVYEVPFGVSLRELLEMAGGTTDQYPFRAILFGGAAGVFITQDNLDIHLTFEDLRSAGIPLGSGAIMVFNQSRDLRDTLKRLGHFFAHESCGKCYPCQLGTQRQKEILDRIAEGNILPGDIERLQDVGWTMTDSSLCGLGQTAASAVLSAIKLFPTLFEGSSVG